MNAAQCLMVAILKHLSLSENNYLFKTGYYINSDFSYPETVYKYLNRSHLIVLQTKLPQSKANIVLYILKCILTQDYGYFLDIPLLTKSKKNYVFTDVDINLLSMYKTEGIGLTIWVNALEVSLMNSSICYDYVPLETRKSNMFSSFPQTVLSIADININLRITADGLRMIYV